mgnify:CR=1 FL=1
MTGDPHPVFQDGLAPEKANARARLPILLGSPDELRALDGTTSWLVYIASLRKYFDRSTDDTTTPDDGYTVIVDANGARWKVTGFGDAAGRFDAYDVIANQSSYDDRPQGFRLFLVDAFGGDGGWIVRDDAGPSGWYGPFPYRGPRGGDRYDFYVDDPDAPISGEIIVKALITTKVTFPAFLLDSKARADVGPEADAVFSIRKNGVQFATCTFDTGVTTGAFVCPADTTFDPDSDDELTIVAPDPMDSLLRRPRMTLTGFRPAT